VTQFRRLLAAFRDAGPFPPILAGILGAAMTTWVTFTALDAVDFRGRAFRRAACANRAPVRCTRGDHGGGRRGSSSIYRSGSPCTLLFGQVTEVRAGPLRYFAFDPLSLDLKAAALAAIAAVLAFRLHRSLIEVVGVMAVLGVVVKLFL